jgi:monothiol glutaredoxin
MNDVLAEIQQEIRDNKVVLYMKGTPAFPMCGFSAAVVKVLKEVGVPFKAVDVLAEPEKREAIKQFSNWPTIPQLYVGGKFVGGCDIVRELFTNGELAKVLGADATEVQPPRISVSDAALAAFQAASADAGGEALHFQVGAGYQYDLYFGPRESGEIEVQAGALTILVDRATARRADGVRIDFVEGGGGGFKIDNPHEPPHVLQIAAPELSEMLKRGEVDLFDVRPAAERARARIEGARPLDEGGSEHLASLPKDRPIAFHCHHGMRSQAAAERAIGEGFTRVYNLRGGIEAWSTSVDPKIPRY